MTSIRVRSARGNYSVCVGAGLLTKAGRLCGKVLKIKGGKSKPTKVMVVTQKKVARYYLKPLAASLRRSGFRISVFYAPDGERAKSQRELFRLYHALLSGRFERRDFILALGGGVVGDLAGFAASTFLRGIPSVNIGTTLLAQVDSAIGGKTGINMEEGKNLVGTFYPPALVLSDIKTLKTLPMRELRASLAEVVKYGVIRDARLFRMLEKKAPAILEKKEVILKDVTATCARIKAEVVSRDEKETKGERMILNYGHTFGHAFEQCLAYKKIMHGEAVAAGMVCAGRLAVRMGLLTQQDQLRQVFLLKRFGLPVDLSRYRLKASKVIEAMMTDKKKNAGRLNFVLPGRIGRVGIHQGVPLRLVRQVLLEMGCSR